MDARLLVVAADLLLGENLQQHDQSDAITEVLGEVVDEQLLNLKLLVAPSGEGLLLDELPFRVQVLVNTRHLVVVPGDRK